MQQTVHQHPPLNVEGLMQATLRLSDVMAEESSALREMRIQDLPKFQDEKLKLAETLEAYQQKLAGDPSFAQSLDPALKEELALLTDDLAFNVEDNFRRVSAAKMINQRIMQVIMDAVNEGARPGTYGPNGQAANAGTATLSMKLDQRA